MTSADHPSGTDRLAEVALNYEDVDVIVSIRKEPMIRPGRNDWPPHAFRENPDRKWPP